MSLIPHFMTQGIFWAAFLPGAACGAVVTQLGTYANNRISDNRKKKHEDLKLDRTETREDKKESDERIRKACTDYAGVCEEVLAASLDVKGLFNIFRDAFQSETGQIDQNAMQKAMFAETQVDEIKRVGKAYNNLKMEASGPIMQAATRLYQSLQVLLKTTTKPLARPVAYKSVAEELNNFIGVFRDEFGIDRYGSDEVARDTETYLETLKSQVADFVEEAKQEMRKAGFKTTPWDTDI